jgi:hypothetical protein
MGIKRGIWSSPDRSRELCGNGNGNSRAIKKDRVPVPVRYPAKSATLRQGRAGAWPPRRSDFRRAAKLEFNWRLYYRKGVLKGDPMRKLSRELRALEGRRVDRFFPCLRCGSDSGVLLQHCAVDELEIYCDTCEAWSGTRLTEADVRSWRDKQPAQPRLLEMPA